MPEPLGWVVLCFHTLGTPVLDCVLLRIIFNFSSLCVPSMVKTLPGNSHWDRRLQSTTVMRRWLSTSHLHRWFLPSPNGSLVSQMLLIVLQQSHKERPCKAAQHLLVYAQLHLIVISAFLMGIWRNKFWSVALGKGGWRRFCLLSPVLLSVFALKEVSFLKEPISLEFWWGFPGIHTRLMSKCCSNCQLFGAAI